jgi:hypothetical protein
VLEEPLDALNLSCYDKGDDVIDNIDELYMLGDINGMRFIMMEIPFTKLKVVFNCFIYNNQMWLLPIKMFEKLKMT